MLTIEEAQARILDDVPRVRSEDVPLDQAYGRWLAEPLVALDSLPPWDNSGMDGYAVCAADLAGASPESPVSLTLLETIGAGGWPTQAVRPGAASAVMTGAPIPQGADSVVMIEDTDGARSGSVVVRAAARVGQHIRPAGDDVKKGTTVLARGTRLGPVQVGLASALGYGRLAVARRPRVVILSTGDEVVAPGRPLAPGQIWSSNNASLVGLAREAGVEVVDGGIVPDTFEATVKALRDAVGLGVDAVITTGGVSVGEFDFVKDAIAGLGGRVEFWKVKMKPGKPLAYGRVGKVPLFGLPGNPVSCIVNFHQFVRPWLLACMGASRSFLPVLEATAGEDLHERPGRFSLMRVKLAWKGGKLVATSAGNPSSGAMLSMSRAHGYALFADTSEGARAGESVRVQLIDPSFLDGFGGDYGW